MTPFELEIALKADRSWTGKYVLDFEQLLNAIPGKHGCQAHDQQKSNNLAADEEHSDGDEDNDLDRPMFSLITGKYRHAKKYGGQPSSFESTLSLFTQVGLVNDAPDEQGSSAVILRNGDNTVARLPDSAAGKNS